MKKIEKNRSRKISSMCCSECIKGTLRLSGTKGILQQELMTWCLLTLQKSEADRQSEERR